MGHLDAEAGESIAGIEMAAHRGADLTKMILDFAKFQPEAFGIEDVREVVSEAIVLARPTFPPGITLRSENAAFSVPVRGNRSQLMQAVLNLVINARDACGPGGEVVVELSAANGFASLAVRDNGTGIKSADREHIFEPFFTTKAPGAGTGLGLAICYRTVRDHQGTIEVDSEAGEGTTFIISLPLSSIALAS
jgi:signal transduction histidine kinase